LALKADVSAILHEGRDCHDNIKTMNTSDIYQVSSIKADIKDRFIFEGFAHQHFNNIFDSFFFFSELN
jgi:hypothetical protein